MVQQWQRISRQYQQSIKASATAQATGPWSQSSQWTSLPCSQPHGTRRLFGSLWLPWLLDELSYPYSYPYPYMGYHVNRGRVSATQTSLISPLAERTLPFPGSQRSFTLIDQAPPARSQPHLLPFRYLFWWAYSSEQRSRMGSFPHRTLAQKEAMQKDPRLRIPSQGTREAIRSHCPLTTGSCGFEECTHSHLKRQPQHHAGKHLTIGSLRETGKNKTDL